MPVYGNGALDRRPGSNLTFGLLELLGREIVVGSYEGRAFPTEAELAHTHGVSRSVTREAVKMLTTKGLISARPGRGITVQSSQSWNLFDPDVLRWLLELEFSLPLLRQFAQLRLAIEPEAAALAARSGSDEQLRRVQSAYDRMASAEDAEVARKADIAFHEAILEASDNPFFAQFQPLVATALSKSIHFTKCHIGKVMSLPEHEDVLRAILARDACEAHRAMRRIIEGVIAVISAAAEERREAAQASN